MATMPEENNEIPGFSKLDVIVFMLISSAITILTMIIFVEVRTDSITRTSTEKFLVTDAFFIVAILGFLVAALSAVSAMQEKNSDPTTEGEEDVI